jgi:hypothetical protein
MSDTEGFGQLVDPDMDQVDAVKAAANGTPWLIAKSAAEEGAAGLFDEEFVRAEIAKAETPESTPGDAVTVSGSPAAVADVMARMHEASVRKAKMSTSDINDLPDSAFAYIEPGGTKDSEGKTVPRSKRHFPVHDKAHADNAAARIGQGAEFGDKAKAKVEAAQRKFGEKVSKADGDVADPGSPAWESQDAASAEAVVGQILACIPSVKKLAMREATEVGAGHLDDICDVLELQAAIDQLTCAAKTVAGFAVGEHAEAGETVTKAQPAPSPAAPAATAPKENPVSETQGATGAENVAKAEDAQPVVKTADAVASLGITQEQLAQLGLQTLLKAAADANQTSGASGAPADTARVIPGTDTVQAPAAAATDDVAKAQANDLVAALTQALAPVVKQVTDLTTQVNAQQERVEKAMARPDDRKSPLLNGATGSVQLAGRGEMSDSPVNSEAFQAVVKAVRDLPPGAARENAERALAVSAIKGRFGHDA